jgi:hypothetical protein
MNDHDEAELRQRLKSAMPKADPELRRDLWPDVEKGLRNTEQQSVPWFDWILLGAAAAGLISLPQIIPVLLYHL